MFCSPPWSGISANRVHNLSALNTEGCYLLVILGMRQIPSSPSCYTKNQKERDQEKTKLIMLPRVQNAPLGRLIFEPVNVIIRSLEVGLRLAIERKTLKEKVWMEHISFTSWLTQGSWFLWEMIQKWVVMIQESLSHNSYKRKRVVGERCLPNFT